MRGCPCEHRKRPERSFGCVEGRGWPEIRVSSVITEQMRKTLPRDRCEMPGHHRQNARLSVAESVKKAESITGTYHRRFLRLTRPIDGGDGKTGLRMRPRANGGGEFLREEGWGAVWAVTDGIEDQAVDHTADLVSKEHVNV